MEASTVEKILVYLGPSLPLAQAQEILPAAIYRPPCKQSDLVSDVINYKPNRIILIDGVFRENLSPWHKEACYVLMYPGVRGIYGASSMGALRAAELDYLGMIGIGRIYEWYRDGVTEDDSEVALLYSHTGLSFYPQTVPLVNIRAANPPADFLDAVRAINYMDRTAEACQWSWEALGNKGAFPCYDQKAADAIEALSNFRAYESQATVKPTPDNLSAYFDALYDRDRRIKVNGTEIPQQHIDAHVILHNPEWERICWDSANQELALLLCNCLCVMVTMEEVSRESERFQQRAEITTAEDFHDFLENNGWSKPEYDRLMVQNTRIRKLQHHLMVSKMYRRNTQSVVDYLRTHQGFDYWAKEVAAIEERLKARGTDDWLSINLDKSAFSQLQEHFDHEGMDLSCTPEEYLLATGFSNPSELSIALQRSAAGEEDSNE